MKEECPVCGVVIENNTVLFSFGPSGTRSRLYARVCQYSKDKVNCINKEVKGSNNPSDYYTLPDELTDPQTLVDELKKDK